MPRLLCVIAVVATLASNAAAETRPRMPVAGARGRQLEDPLRHGSLRAPGLLSPTGTAEIASSSGICGAWSELAPHQWPFYRRDHPMVYDSARDRLLIFGGVDESNQSRMDVWALTLGATPTLAQIPTQGQLELNSTDGASAIYDPVRDRLVIMSRGFSGNGGAWALNLSGTPTWTEIVAAGTAPEDRGYHSAIYDAARDRMVVFGGWTQSSNGMGLNEVWALSFSGTPTWTLLNPGGVVMPGRTSHTAVYDGPRDRMVVFGGYDENGLVSQNDTYALALAGAGSWSQINPSGDLPVARAGHTAIADVPRNRMLVFAGFDDQANPLPQVWSLSFTNPIRWTEITSSTPGPQVQSCASVYDPLRQRMLSFLGSELWALGGLASSPSWSEILSASRPLPLAAAAVVHDPPRQRVLVFGGVTSTGALSDDLWAYSFTSSTWTRIVPSGLPPSARFLATFVYDPVADRAILFGGTDGQMFNEAWQLSLGATPAWTLLTPSGTPPAARCQHVAILDAPRNRMIVHGGEDFTGIERADVWALSLSGGTSWSELHPSGGPAPPRRMHSGIFDAPRNRLLTFGFDSNVVWALSLAGSPAWSTVTAAGTPPPALFAHVGAYDAARERMLITMGLPINGQPVPNLTHVLTLSGTPTWETVTPAGGQVPFSRSDAGSMFDPVGDRLVVFGGNSDFGYRNDMHALSFASVRTLTVAVSPAGGGAVQQQPSGTCQAVGAQVTLTATPAGNYVFTGWSGDASGTESPLTVTMDADKTITANFIAYTLNVSVNPAGVGTVAKSPNQSLYSPGQNVTLTASPTSSSYGFTGWSGDASGTQNPLAVTMDANKSITANFATYPLTVSVSPAGTGSVTRNPNQSSYAPGTQVTLTANSSTHVFESWSGGASDNSNPVVVTVNGPTNVIANFATGAAVNVTIQPPGTGAVTRDPNLPVYPLGSNVTLTANTSPYLFTGWGGDASGTTNPLTITVDGTKNITASFQAFTLTTNVTGGGAVGRSPGKSFYGDGEVVTVTAFPGLGWSFDSWSGDLTGSENPKTIEMHANATVTANFVQGGPKECGNWNTVPTVSRPGNTGEGASFVWDPVRHRLLWSWGGAEGPLWQLTTGTTDQWTQLLSTSGLTPRGMPIVYDPVRDRLIYFGGLSGTSSFRNAVWVLPLTTPLQWSQVSVVGPLPSARSYHSCVYDPAGDRLIVFGGWGFNGGSDPAALGDLWSLSLSGTPTWTQLTPGGTAPSARSGHGAVYEPSGPRMWVFGGSLDPTVFSLALSGSLAWTSMTPVGAPHSTGGYSYAYDPVRNRAICVGGSPSASGTSALTLGNRVLWSRLDRGTSPGDQSVAAAMVYDPDHDAMFLRGYIPSGTLVTTMRYDCGPGAQVDVGGNDGTVLVEACYESGSTGTLVAQPNPGWAFSHWLGDATGTANPLNMLMNGYKVIEAVFVPATTGVEEPPTAFALGEIRPNPNPGQATIAYSLAREAPVRLRVFDLAGRQIETLVDGIESAGRHTVAWRSPIGNAGMYLVRYETPAGSWSKRMVVLP